MKKNLIILLFGFFLSCAPLSIIERSHQLLEKEGFEGIVIMQHIEAQDSTYFLGKIDEKVVFSADKDNKRVTGEVVYKTKKGKIVLY